LWWRNLIHAELFEGFLPSFGLLKLILCLKILQELLQLEEDVKLLEEMYPQGEKVMVVNYGSIALDFLLLLVIYVLTTGRDLLGFDCSWLLGKTCVGNFRVSNDIRRFIILMNTIVSFPLVELLIVLRENQYVTNKLKSELALMDYLIGKNLPKMVM
jgi:hypothetical protein